MRIPIIETSTNVVVNVIEVAEGQEIAPGEGRSFGPEGGEIGDTWDGNAYASPPQPEPETVVPHAVSKLQLVRALRAENLVTAFETAMSQADAETQEDWQICYEVYRADPVVEALGAAIGLDGDGLDALFVSAAEM